MLPAAEGIAHGPEFCGRTPLAAQHLAGANVEGARADGELLMRYPPHRLVAGTVEWICRYLDLGPPLGSAAKVAELDVLSGMHQDVFQLQVTVDVVKGLQPRCSAGYLPDTAKLLLVRKWGYPLGDLGASRGCPAQT